MTRVITEFLFLQPWLHPLLITSAYIANHLELPLLLSIRQLVRNVSAQVQTIASQRRPQTLHDQKLTQIAEIFEMIWLEYHRHTRGSFTSTTLFRCQSCQPLFTQLLSARQHMNPLYQGVS
jgi:hypothetical protein